MGQGIIVKPSLITDNEKDKYDSFCRITDFTSDIITTDSVKKLWTTYIRRQGDIVVFNFNITFTINSDYTVKLGTLPVDCRPLKSVGVNTITNKGISCYIYVNEDGSFGVTLSKYSSSDDGCRNIIFYFANT